MIKLGKIGDQWNEGTISKKKIVLMNLMGLSKALTTVGDRSQFTTKSTILHL